MATTNPVASLNNTCSDFVHVYFKEGDAVTDYSNPDFEFPVIDGSINYNTGDINKSYIRTVDGKVISTKFENGDPDISFDVASNNSLVIGLFGGSSVGNYILPDITGTHAAYKVELSRIGDARGTVIFTDDNGHAEILPGCRLVASRQKGDIACWHVVVEPGGSVIIV